MGNYISKVTPIRPVFGKKLDESNIIVGEEILETPNQSGLNEEQEPNNPKDSLKADEHSQSEDNEANGEPADDHHTNDSHTNGFTNGQSNGHSSSNGHTNGHSIDNADLNGANEEANEEEEELNGEQHSNGKLSKTDLKNKKADKPYSNKKGSSINEDDPVEPQQDEEELDSYEVVGRKRKGRKATTPKKQYKKRKNHLLVSLEKVNELVVDE